jgi:hypothetical protein
MWIAMKAKALPKRPKRWRMPDNPARELIEAIGLPPESGNDEGIADLIRAAGHHGVDQSSLDRLLCKDRKDHAVADLAADMRVVSLQLMTAARQGQRLAKELARKETRGKGAPVLLGKILAPAVIDEIAARLIDVCEGDKENILMAQELATLVQSRLRPAAGKRLTEPRRPMERHVAAIFFATIPDAKEREVAAAVGVAHTTIQDWRREPSFQEAIRQARTIPGIDKIRLGGTPGHRGV